MKSFANNIKMEAIKPTDDWELPKAKFIYWFQGNYMLFIVKLYNSWKHCLSNLPRTGWTWPKSTSKQNVAKTLKSNLN